MDICSLLKKTERPRPYEPGTAVMWTDPYIAGQLLETHLNPDTDLASRRPGAIDRTVAWIHGLFGENRNDVLDLGCGPGLYCQRFARLGYRVTGLDYSPNSIDYAVAGAARDNLAIDYRCMNYLELDMENRYDLAILIYCDLGVLPPGDRDRLLARIHRALRPGGVLIFNALNPKSLTSMGFERSWEMTERGFWRDRPYLCLTDRFHYPERKAVMDQHIVFDEQDRYEIYRFWNHYFTLAEVAPMTRGAGFRSSQAHDFRLDGPQGDEVTFFSAIK